MICFTWRRQGAACIKAVVKGGRPKFPWVDFFQFLEPVLNAFVLVQDQENKNFLGSRNPVIYVELALMLNKTIHVRVKPKISSNI